MAGGVLVVLILSGYAIFDMAAENQALQSQVTILKQAQGQVQSTPAQTKQVIHTVPAGTVPPLRPDDHIEGSRSAPLVLIEYADYECPFCQQLHGTLQTLQAEFGDQLAVVYRQYPLPIHQGAEMKSLIGECVASTAGEAIFWRYTHALFTEPVVSEQPGVISQAVAVGAAQASLEQCLKDGTSAARVNRDKQEGTQAGITGTPASFIIQKDGTVTAVAGAISLEAFRSVVTGLLH